MRAAGRQPAPSAAVLLVCVLLLAAAMSASAQLPPGAQPAVLDLPLGTFAYCAGSYTNQYPETFGQGTVARFGSVIGAYYDTRREAMYLGTDISIIKIDKTCTASKVAGAVSQGDATGGSPSFANVIAITSLPNGPLIVGDYNCRLRTVDPDTGYTAHFGPTALGQHRGGSCASYLVSGVNTLGSPPVNDATNGISMGIPRDIKLSKRDGRLYAATMGGSNAYSEIWSLSTDGTDVRVIFQLNDGGTGTGVNAVAPDPSDDFVYVFTQSTKKLFKVATRAPYASSLFYTVPTGTEGWKMHIVTNLAGGNWRLLPFTTSMPSGGGTTIDATTPLLDRSGAVVGTIKAPAEMCPAVVASNAWGSCYAMGMNAAAEDGLVYMTYGNLTGLAVYAYRAVPRASSIRLSNGASIDNFGGIITIS